MAEKVTLTTVTNEGSGPFPQPSREGTPRCPHSPLILCETNAVGQSMLVQTLREEGLGKGTSGQLRSGDGWGNFPPRLAPSWDSVLAFQSL